MSLAQKIAPWIGSGQLGCEIGASLGLKLDPAPIRVDDRKTRRGAAVQADFHGHVGHLPFHDHALDYVVATHALECAPDPAAALAECYRVVRPGGSVCLIVAAADIRPAVLREQLLPPPAEQPRLLWEVAAWAEEKADTLAILRVHKGWLARAQAEVFRLRSNGHPRAALRDDAQSFAEWAANQKVES